MPDSTAIFQLSRQLVRILGNRDTTTLAQVAQCLAEFWAADACWLWPTVDRLVFYSNQPTLQQLQLLPQIQTGQSIAAGANKAIQLDGYQVMWIAVAQGYMAVARTTAWTAVDRENLAAIADLVAVAFTQVELQQQVEYSQQSMRQVQAIADERTAQLQSSQNLLSKLQEANRRRIKQLDESNRLKDEFISTISHELRTPLTSMSLAIRMLRQPSIDETRRTKYLEILEQQCTQEVNLINDLLTLQQLESKQINVDRQLVNLLELVQPLVEQFQVTWASKQLQLQVDLPAAFSWHTEPASMQRILQELLTNAGKFAQPQTTVQLQVTVGKQLRIEVINQGRLITAEEQSYIFAKFRRGQGVTQQAIAGTGLGLALVKSLVQHLQGKISVSSQPAAEFATTCFEVSLPVEEP